MRGAADPVRARLFQIGFRRCGTTALAAFLERCAIPCVHHDRGRLAQRMRDNLAAGRAPLDGYDRRYAAFTNMDFQTPAEHFEGFRHFAALFAAYGGRYILNTRPVDRWLASLMRNAGRAPVRAAHRARFGTDDPCEVAGHWRAAWEAHHGRVLAEVPAQRLLVFDIESDPPERLCDFVGVARSCARLYTVENPRMRPFAESLAAALPPRLRRAAPEPLKRRVKKLLCRRQAGEA